MPYSGSQGEIAALYLDEGIGGATSAFTFGGARVQFGGAGIEGFTGVLDPGAGTGVVRPTAAALDYIIVTEAGWYRCSYCISGKIGATADGGTMSICANVGSVAIAAANDLPGSECSVLALTGQLECLFMAEVIAYLQENTYLVLAHEQYSAGGVGVFHNGTFIVERVVAGS